MSNDWGGASQYVLFRPCKTNKRNMKQKSDSLDRDHLPERPPPPSKQPHQQTKRKNTSNETADGNGGGGGGREGQNNRTTTPFLDTVV